MVDAAPPRGQTVNDRVRPSTRRSWPAAGGDTEREIRLNVIAIIAPSDAPAETPSVSGDARGPDGERRPDSASALPTSAAGCARQTRDEKICASTLSAYGIDRSKARPR
jgi:hypothetical protein